MRWFRFRFGRLGTIGGLFFLGAALELSAEITLSSVSAGSPDTPAAINRVSISKPFFNPSLGQSVDIDFFVERPGSLTVDVVDSQQSRIRRLLRRTRARPGVASAIWDGRDESGTVVPDEAYSLRIELRSGGGTETYFPASEVPLPGYVSDSSYDRAAGILRYVLARPSRVRVVAGVSRQGADRSGEKRASMTVLVDGEPRVAGAVIQQWDGYDETGSVYLPDLPGFAWRIEAVDLPNNAIITVGNRGTSPNQAGRTEARDTSPSVHR